MADAEDVRRIALHLPDVVEIPSEGFDFRVDNRGFVWSYPEGFGRGRRIRPDIAVLFVGDEAEKQALLRGEPELFFTTPPTSRSRWSCCGSTWSMPIGCAS